MPPKKIRTDTYGNAQPDLFAKVFSKPKPYTENSNISAIRLKTTQALIDITTDPIRKAELQGQLLAQEMALLGYKSSPIRQVLTIDEDKAKRQSRFKEDNDVAAWGKWFKTQYPGIPFTIDKVAQRRSKLGGTIHKASAYQSGNPDIFVQSSGGTHYNGLFIEQKRSEDVLFYKGTRLLKPGSNNHHIWQSIYHQDLRDQGFYVTFSISLEASKKITERYMSGNPFPQQIFRYKFNPETMKEFEGMKNFCPII